MPTIYDHTGRPVRSRDLKDAQARRQEEHTRAKLGGSAGQHAYGPARGTLSAYGLARLLQAGDDGDLGASAALYAVMDEKDTHMGAMMDIRKKAVSGRPWQIQPGDDSPKAAEIADFCQRALEALDLGTVLYDALDATGKGVSAQEITWDLSGGQAVPVAVEAIEQTRLGWLEQGRTVGLVQPAARFGEELEPLLPYKWIVHQVRARSGSPYRASLYRTLAWLYLFRNYSVSSWARFVEGFGIPTRLGKYPATATDEEQDTLLAACQAISAEAAVVIPQGMEVELLEAKIAGAGRTTPHQAFMDWATGAVATAITGGTLATQTSSSGGGAYALGAVHDKVRWDLQQDDGAKVAATLDRDLLRPMVELNFGPQESFPQLTLDIPKPLDLEATSRWLQTLVGTGFDDIPLWWLRDTFRIPAPAEGEETLADLRKASRTTQSPGVPGVVNRMMSPPQTNAAREDDAFTGLSDAATEAYSQQAQDALVAPMLEVLQDATSYDEALAKLDGLFDHKATEALGAGLAKAQFIAALQGAADLPDEPGGPDEKGGPSGADGEEG